MECDVDISVEWCFPQSLQAYIGQYFKTKFCRDILSHYSS
jgi:hypothetical protein